MRGVQIVEKQKSKQAQSFRRWSITLHECSPYCILHIFDLLQNFIIPESQRPKALSLQPRAPLNVVRSLFLLLVLPSINLDH